jgi:hypothetical protein
VQIYLHFVQTWQKQRMLDIIKRWIFIEY